MIKSSFVLFAILLVAGEIKSDGIHHDSPPGLPTPPGIPTPPEGGYNLPPPPAVDPSPNQPQPGPGLFPAFPGFGFQKSLHLNSGAGFGPYLGGVPPVAPGAGFGSYLGGVPPVAPGGVPPVPPVDGGLGGEGGPFGGFQPSYVPSTWLGSALGAKGDILFPCVIIIFFLVGVWTVIQFLLVLIVPLIGAKMGLISAVVNAKGAKFSRSVSEGNRIECDAKNVTEAIEKYTQKYMTACGCKTHDDGENDE